MIVGEGVEEIRGTPEGAGGQSIMDEPEAGIGRTAAEPSRVVRPWGTYTVLHVGETFQVKVIEVAAGKRLSLQFHRRRDEHWTVVSGAARVTKGEKTFLMSENETVHIPRKETHRIENVGTVPLVFVEVQCGDYFGEDDIVRLADDHGRRVQTGAKRGGG